MGESDGMGTTRKKSYGGRCIVVSLMQVAVYLCFSKQQNIGVDSVQHQGW